MNKSKELLNMIGTTVTYDEILKVREDKDTINFAKNNNLVIVYGYSDDNIEFEGAIYDEFGAWEEENIFVTIDKNIIHEDIFDNEEWKNGYIARDMNGYLFIFKEKPFKHGNIWLGDGICNLTIFNHLFPYIKWEDKEPKKISDLIKKYEEVHGICS